MIIQTFETGPVRCNCSIVGCSHTREALIVDPGGDAEEIIARVKDLGLNVRQILITHGHFDHVLAARAVKKATGAKIAIHRKDRWLYRITPVQSKLFCGAFRGTMPPRPDRWLAEGDVIKTGELLARVMHTPGHSPGACCFHLEEERLLFSGDTLFAGSIGQWRYPGGNIQQIFASVDRLMELPDETHVIPGHGPETSIGEERAGNQYIDAAYREMLLREEADRPSFWRLLGRSVMSAVGLRKGE